MGIQDDFSADTTTSLHLVGTARATDTVNYITDLLGELQSIAAITGLSNLSNDINAVMSKYTTESVKV